MKLGRNRTLGLSLSAQMALVTVSAVVIAVLVSIAVAFPLTRQAAVQESSENLSRLAAATAATIERGGSRGATAIRDRLASTLESEEIQAYYVPPGAGIPGLLTPPEIGAIASGQLTSGRRVYQGKEVLVTGRPLRGGGVVVLVQPTDAVGGLAASTLARLSVALLVGVAIAVVFGLLLARRITKSLREAAQAAQRLGAGERTVELAVDGPPEIAELAEALNDLQRALTASEGRQREFLLSVSHELRTPLTAIQGYSEAIADSVIPSEELAATGNTMLTETHRLDLLISDLLDLARLDAVDFRISATEIDLLALAQDAAVVWRHQCERAGVELRSEFDGEVPMIVADPTRIRQIVDNLCANALRVVPSGGVIVLAVARGDHNTVIIQVRDSGPGLTDDDMSVAFVPGELYQRYRGERRVGTGVGLALVGRMSLRLGGAARAARAPEGGACFTIELPVEAPAEVIA